MNSTTLATIGATAALALTTVLAQRVDAGELYCLYSDTMAQALRNGPHAERVTVLSKWRTQNGEVLTCTVVTSKPHVKDFAFADLQNRGRVTEQLGIVESTK